MYQAQNQQKKFIRCNNANFKCLIQIDQPLCSTFSISISHIMFPKVASVSILLFGAAQDSKPSGLVSSPGIIKRKLVR